MDELFKEANLSLPTKEFVSSWQSLLYGFLANLKSPHTQLAYKRDLQLFADFLQAKFSGISFLQVQQEHLVAFRHHLQRYGGRKQGTPAETKSINRRISALKKFYRYLCQREVLKKNPAEWVDLLPIPSTVKTKVLTKEQWQKIIKAPVKRDFSSLFHHAVLMILFTTGMRKSELIHLKMKNLQRKGEFLLLEYQAKRSKIITKPLNEACQASVLAYLQKCQEKGFSLEEEEYLFRAEKKSSLQKNAQGKLHPSTVDYIVKKAGEKIGLDPKQLHAHMARATVITLLYQKGVDLKAIQDFVGHSSVQMTVEYIKKEQALQDSPSFLLS
jgi:site-specific recombinase XerD